MKVGFIYDEIFLAHETPQWHPENKERLNAIIAKVRGAGLWEKLDHIPPQMAETSHIEAVHHPDYVKRVMDASPGYFDPDTFFSAGTLKASLYAAGSIIEGINACHAGSIDSAFCAVRPPGHHAEADRAMGFCFFNNVAVGARYAQGLGYEKVFITDFDVHHGNATEHMFYDDDTVFYFSTHQYPHYPGTGSEKDTGRGKGKGFNYNIPMGHGSGDKQYMEAYNDILHDIVNKFDPDIFLVSAGYDLHANDPLAGIKVSDEGIRSIVKGILTSKNDIPYIFTLEGGYDLNALGDSVVITLEEMLSA
ncbi:MAG: histone deacetylase [Nitrospirota bacterium]|nr:MAG: histone deacetylase [Nitrospirota bacterium]